MHPILCKNCEHTFEGKFCSNCGQKSNVGELKMHDFLHELWHSVTHTDSGILKLIKDLFTHPKRVYFGYFSGKRKTYFSPVTFFLITATILLLIGNKIYDYEDYVRLADNPNGYNEMGRYVFDMTKFKTLILLPFQVVLIWLFYHKRFNLAKIIVFFLYFHGLIFVIQIIISPIYFLFILHKELLDSIVAVITFILLFWHLNLVFGMKNWKTYLLNFILLNVFHIINYLVIFYLLYGEALFEQTKTKNIFGFILELYKL